jgi:peptidyl-prolyl cis-trans isomerase SurA
VRLTILAALSLLTGLLTVLGGPPSAEAQTQSASRIAAVVNDDIVSTQDLRDRLRLAILFSGLPSDVETQRRIAPQVLRRMIDERLQLQEGRRLGVTVQRQEVMGAVQNAASANNMTPNQLLGFLAEQGVDPAAFERQIEAELTWLRLVQRQFGDRVVVTDQQVDLALDVASSGGQVEVLLAEIVLPIYDPAETEAVLAEADDLRAAIAEGGDFAAIARQVSASGSRNDGGDLGWVPINAVQASLRPVLEELAPGQVSEPVITPSGVQLFFVRDRRTGGRNVSTDLRQVAQLLFPLAPGAPEATVANVLAEAREATDGVADCRDMDRVARQRALPSSGDMGWVRPGDLPAEMVQAVRTLPIQTLSQPIRSGTGLHFVMVCADGRSSGPEARRADMRRDLENEQLERLAGRYLRDLRKDAFIDVRVSG